MIQPQSDPPSLALPADSSLPPIAVGNNELKLFVDSASYIGALVADIRSARRRVWIESYIVSADSAGNAVAEALAERAAAGVDCRFMYDYVGSGFTPAAFFSRLAAAGAAVHEFHGWRLALAELRFFRVFNQRNHRKLCVIDDRIAYFGGMNLADQAPLATQGDVLSRGLPPSAGWRDVHVRLTGPAQGRLAAIMDGLWRKKLRLKRRRSLPWRVRRMFARRRDHVYFFDTRPGLRRRRPARVLVPLIDGAERRITVAMAYFIPQGAVLRALLRARERGVTVRVIVPEKSDVPIVRWCSRYLYGLLLKRGIRLYERRDEMLHSKVLAIDDDWTVVGSCNLDPRSLQTNLEFLAAIRSSQFNRAVKRICAHDLRSSRRVTWHDYAGRGWTQRVLDWLAWRLRRWL